MIDKNPIGSVVYGTYGATSKPFQHARMSPYSHAFVSDRIREAIQGAGLWILGEVDAQALVGRGGYAIGGALQILAFHPRFLTRVLAEDPSALLGAPLKFAILELADRSVAVSWTNQAIAFARYDRATLAELGRELDELCDAIVTNALR